MPDDPTQNASDSQSDEQGEGNLPTTIEGWQRLAEARDKRFREEKARREHLQTQVDTVTQRLTAKEQAEQERLKKQGNFEEIAQQRAAEVESLKPIAERAAALEKVIRASNDERIKAIPDSKKNLVQPLVDVLPPEKLQEYLNANPTLFEKTPAPDFDGGKGGNGSGGKGDIKVTDEDRRQAAIATANGHAIKAEDIAKRRMEMAKAVQNGNQ